MSDPLLREITLETTPELAELRRADLDARLPAFFDVPPAVAARVGRELDLLVVGLGSVGTAAIEPLARFGPRSITLIDPACFKQESPRTHSTVGAPEIGLAKVDVVGRRLKQASPGTRVLVFQGPFEALPLGVVAHAGFWLICTDNLRAELRVTATALQLGRVHLQGSVYGPALIAQVRSLASHAEGNAPCLACGYSEAEWRDADRGTLFSCSGPLEAERAWAPSQAPTRSVAPLCATAGSLVALEATRRLLGIGDAGESRMLQLGGYDLRTTLTPLLRNPDCPLPHAPARLRPEDEPISRRTPRELLERAGYADAELRRVTLDLPRWHYAKLTACRCRAHEVLERFVSADGSAGRCPRCQQERGVHPFYVSREVPFAELGPRLDRSLASLGATSPASACVRGDRGTCLVYRALPATGIPQELCA